MTRRYTPILRYHRIDGWRGYRIPATAVAGASDTGTWSDSPCPTPEVKAEIRGFQHYLNQHGIHSRTRIGHSSNVFCGKRWVCVAKDDFNRAAQLVGEYLRAQDAALRYLHDADLEQCSLPGEVS